ncbi:MAG: hypothetical protein ABIL86_08745 [candidate division WOR-3 bacterium]
MINVVRIHLDNDIPIQLRGVFVAHEFFHAVQFTGYDPGEAEWWIEGTAVWMEDEVYDDVNNYVGYIHHFTDCPEWSLDNSNSDHEYGAVIFPKLISERRGVGQIRVIWQGCGVQQDNSVMKVLVETSPGLDKLKSFQDFFKSFVCANYIKTGVDGYEEEADYPEVHIEQRYNTVPPNNNQHYANRPPDNIGSPVPWEEGNFPNGSPIWLPHLACHYIRVVKPVQIDDRTMLYFNFEGDGEKLI